ncbi:MAG: hypothetical protein KDJ90_06710 [Nitratireductor sp.]|nr:hypothetical protein [Nitratireductor sp.]
MPREAQINRDCPKCGSGRIKATAHQVAEDAVETTVSCLACTFNITVEDAFADYDTAINLWNTTARKEARNVDA